MLARSHFVRLFAKCQREDLDAGRLLTRFSDPLLLRGTGRAWTGCIGSIALPTHRLWSLHLTLRWPDREGQRSTQLAPCEGCPFVEPSGFECFGGNSEPGVALFQRATRTDLLSQCKFLKSTNNLHSLSVGGMEAVRGKTLEENCSTSMECSQESIEEPPSDKVSPRDSPDHADRFWTDINTAQLLGNDISDGSQKAEDAKRKKPKVRKMKKNQSAAEKEVNSLLAELPFLNAKIREEYGFSSAPEKNLKKKRKRTLGGENDEDTCQMKKKKIHPNYFVSIPITNPKIVSGIKAVQDFVAQTDERLSKAMIPISCLHITVLVTHLASDVEVNKAVSTIEECKEPVQEILLGKQLVLEFCGIADFRGEVVFAQLVQNEQLATLIRIAEIVKKKFQANGILTGDSRAFKPHLTFMKRSRAPKLHHQGIKKISPELYQNFKNHYFGDEVVTCLHLCSMLKKQSNGYYHCETSLIMGEKKEGEPDEEELVSLSKRLVETAEKSMIQT
ncbi:A-kinase anchor protein 7 [Narcine bancroftii]|uniref:A-kinase anchor protein 7 n=1 Tax=Narcine bancroftii TaxID=1343680 RepID=UPI0038315F0D